MYQKFLKYEFIFSLLLLKVQPDGKLYELPIICTNNSLNMATSYQSAPSNFSSAVTIPANEMESKNLTHSPSHKIAHKSASSDVVDGPKEVKLESNKGFVVFPAEPATPHHRVVDKICLKNLSSRDRLDLNLHIKGSNEFKVRFFNHLFS